MSDDKPKWSDLFGIDPDYTDGRPVDEWLEESRGGIPHPASLPADHPLLPWWVMHHRETGHATGDSFDVGQWCADCDERPPLP